MSARRGEYEGLVRRAEEEFRREEGGVDRRTSEVSALGDASVNNAVLETIERDIHRTFPKHYLFHNFEEEEEEEVGNGSVDESERDDSDEDDDDSSHDVEVEGMTEENRREKKKLFDDMIVKSLSLTGCGGLDDVDHLELSGMDGNLDKIEELKSNGDAKKMGPAQGLLPVESQGAGQAQLRRVLRAYSVYDAEVGYCQGMVGGL